MQDGKIKLGKHDRLLDGSIDKQIDMYRKAMPSCEQEMYYGLWFTFEECPGGLSGSMMMDIKTGLDLLCHINNP
ncbi:hypothetical protein HL670_01159 [Serratia plymuthica]|uniref:DUF596 domain-containing protein n=1 Tax=Serratia plymuthica TaxID=82996 RepID=UPI001597AA5E|nr:DUF596 domain-containing protein [Serratia plymuthica]QJW54291.1 hypothetical protein HL670_01159 [Serratia plymuthica]